MKKTLGILIFLLMLMACMGAMAADSGTFGDNLTWTLDNEGLLTISGTGNMGDVDFLKHGPWGTTYVREINIEYGVTSIGECAFQDCPRLTKVTIPSSVTKIGRLAFYNCNIY